VYRKIGGHSFPWVYSGPIGAIITPQFMGITHEPSLPFASSLCGACAEVCPVKIDIPGILVHLRNEVVEDQRTHRVPTPEAAAMQAAAWVFADARRLRLAQTAAGIGSRPLARRGRISTLPPPFSGWTRARDAPAVPRESFRAWWKRTRG
jgi:L-lactate dehydrogenase complex protein LldF